MSNKVNNFYVPKLKQVGAWYELRDDSKGAKDWRGYRSLSGVVGVVGHHTVTHPTGNAEQEVATIWNIHKQRGFGGIGYNAIITSEEVNGYAKVYLIGDIGSIRAHTPNSKGFRGWKAQYGNNYLLGFSFIGMCHLVAPTDAQYRSAHELVKELIYNENTRLPKLKDWNDLVIHWDCDATACWGSKVDKNKIINPPKLNLEDPKMIEELKNQIKALNNSINTLKEEISGLKTALGDSQKTNIDLTAQINGLKEENEELNAKIKELEKKVKEKSAEIEEQTKELKKLGDRFATLSIERNRIENERGKFEEENSKLKKQLEEQNRNFIKIVVDWIREFLTKIRGDRS